MNSIPKDIQQRVKDINAAIAAYVERRIDEAELLKRTQPYRNADTQELLVRTGNFIIDIALQTISELSYRNTSQRSWLEKYDAEVKSGVQPFETKIPFTLSLHTPTFKIKVENCQ